MHHRCLKKEIPYFRIEALGTFFLFLAVYRHFFFVMNSSFALAQKKILHVRRNKNPKFSGQTNSF